MYGLPIIERWSLVEVPLYFYHYRENVDKRRLSVFNTEIERECQRTQPFEKNKIDNPTLFFFFFFNFWHQPASKKSLSPLERLLKITVILIKAMFLAVSKKFRELLPIEITKTIQNHIPYNQSTFKCLRSQCLNQGLPLNLPPVTKHSLSEWIKSHFSSPKGPKIRSRATISGPFRALFFMTQTQNLEKFVLE